MYVRYFDVDGTIAPIAVNPADTRVDKNFCTFAAAAKDAIVIVTGREDRRVNPGTGTHTVDAILADLLERKPVPIISCHGLACVTADGEVHLHPDLEKAQPAVKKAHAGLPAFREKYAHLPVTYEEKITGITVNINQVAKGAQDAILDDARIFLAPYAYDEKNKNTGLSVYNEHGSVELRPVTGKAEGAAYFIAHGIVPGKGCRKAFSGDSLHDGGTDLGIANQFYENKDIVVQISNGKGDFDKAHYRFANPAEHCKALVNGFNPFADPFAQPFTLRMPS